MSYKNDSLLVIADKYGKASADAKADLFETYDKIRDLSVSGSTLDGSGFGPGANFLMELARMFAPSAFMPILGSTAFNIPGTSYSSPISGGNSITAGGQSAFGMGKMGNYPGFPSGGAAAVQQLGSSLLMGIGSSFASSSSGNLTGGAASITGGASSIVGSSLSPMAGAVSGITSAVVPQGSMVLPIAGFLSGIGSLASALGPYFGPFGALAGVGGNMLTGYASAALNAYQTINGRIINNADTILTEKVKNIETVVKQLDTQGDIVRKMLKENIDGDSKALQSLIG